MVKQKTKIKKTSKEVCRFLVTSETNYFHQLGPTGPSWSVSRHVRVYVCLYVCAIAKHPLPEVVQTSGRRSRS